MRHLDYLRYHWWGNLQELLNDVVLWLPIRSENHDPRNRVLLLLLVSPGSDKRSEGEDQISWMAQHLSYDGVWSEAH